jgi:two-component system, OmpR family, phosphate regulon response regulator PhoB
MPQRVLVVEDERDIRELLGMVLQQHGYQPYVAENVEGAMQYLTELWPDVIILDWMLPGKKGIDFLRQLIREAVTRDIPVIMLTAKAEENDRILGLDAGADDYLTKPFSPRELIARINAVLRRVNPDSENEPIIFNGLCLDPMAYRVVGDGHPLELGPTEYRLLHFFMTHPERVYSREQLLNRVWGTNVYIEDRTIDVHIGRLRRILQPTGHATMIQTVRGAGYRFSGRK